jgi:hypothetical protein
MKWRVQSTRIRRATAVQNSGSPVLHIRQSMESLHCYPIYLHGRIKGEA